MLFRHAAEVSQMELPGGVGTQAVSLARPNVMGTLSADQSPAPVNLPEVAGYFPVFDEHIYTVLHQVENPVARVLLAGPFASERHNSYWAWVRWARFLARKRIEVLRFDYRGVGESTGEFRRMTFHCWMEDIGRLASWMNELSPRRPLLLHGLELGAILAARSFASGIGSALLLWSPPADANALMRANLIRCVTPQQLTRRLEDRRPAKYYFDLLRNGQGVTVDGYEWSPELWRESFNLSVPPTIASMQDQAPGSSRPVRSVKLSKDATPLVRGEFAALEKIKDLNWLFEPECEWLLSAVSGQRIS